MADNNLSAIASRLLVKALPILREQLVMVRTVQTTFESITGELGSKVEITVPVAKAAAPRTATHLPTDASASTPTLKTITCDQWEGVDFKLTDKEMGDIMASTSSWIPTEMEESVRALTNKIERSIASQFEGAVYGIVGTTGVTPFAAFSDASLVVGKLNTQLCPPSPRYGVLSRAAETKALALSEFVQADKRGDNTPLETAILGKVLGVNWVGSDIIAAHTTGTMSNGTAKKANLTADTAKGATSITLDETTLTGTVTVGDVIVHPTDPQTYVCTELATAAANSITIKITPPLKVAWDEDDVIEVKGSYTANLVYHPMAFGFVNRPLPTDGDPNITVVRDPWSGLYLRMERERQNGQTKWTLDALWGAECISPERAVVLAG